MRERKRARVLRPIEKTENLFSEKERKQEAQRVQFCCSMRERKRARVLRTIERT
jgi:hypothetical protein